MPKLIHRSAVAPLGALALAACAGVAEPASDRETGRVYEGVGTDALYERTLAAIRAIGLEVVGTDPGRGVVTAEWRGPDDRGWARCDEPLVVAEGDERGNRLAEVDPPGLRLELTAAVREAPDGARLTLDPTFEQILGGAGVNRASAGECRSTGELERRILAAV